MKASRESRRVRVPSPSTGEGRDRGAAHPIKNWHPHLYPPPSRGRKQTPSGGLRRRSYSQLDLVLFCRRRSGGSPERKNCVRLCFDQSQHVGGLDGEGDRRIREKRFECRAGLHQLRCDDGAGAGRWQRSSGARGEQCGRCRGAERCSDHCRGEQYQPPRYAALGTAGNSTRRAVARQNARDYPLRFDQRFRDSADSAQAESRRTKRNCASLAAWWKPIWVFARGRQRDVFRLKHRDRRQEC